METEIQTASYYDILARIADGDGTFEYDNDGSITYTDDLFIKRVEVRNLNFEAGFYGVGKESVDTVRSLLKEFGIEYTGKLSEDEDEDEERELCRLFTDLLCNKLSRIKLVFTNCSIGKLIPSKPDSIKELPKVTFNSCKFNGYSRFTCNLTSCTFYNCELTGASFEDSVLTNCEFDNPTFKKVSACKTMFNVCKFYNINREKFDINLQDAVFHSCEGLEVYSLLNFGTYFGSVMYMPELDIVRAGCWAGSLVEFIERCTIILDSSYERRRYETASHDERKLRIQFKTAVDYFIEIYKLHEVVKDVPDVIHNRVALFEDSLARLER